MSALHIKKGDTVVVLSGESSGKQGKVLQVLPKARKAVVEGLNIIKRHTRKSQQQPKGGIVEREAPLPVSKLRKVEVEAKAKTTRTRKKAAPKAAK